MVVMVVVELRVMIVGNIYQFHISPDTNSKVVDLVVKETKQNKKK